MLYAFHNLAKNEFTMRFRSPSVFALLALNLSPKSSRMDQSYSPDGGRTWEINWICDLSR
jgi:hypothetical protein